MLGIHGRWTPYKSVSALDGLVETQKPRTIGTAWRRVPHDQMIRALTKALKEEGGTLGKDNLRFYLSRGNADIACRIAVQCDDIGTVNTKVRKTTIPLYPSVGFVASNAHRQALTFFGGFTSTVPDHNLSHVMMREKGSKYTINFDPEKETKSFVSAWMEDLKDMAKSCRLLQEETINRNQVIRYMTEAGSQNLMPWSRAGRVIDSIRGETCTKWTLLMKFSEMVAMNPPNVQMEQQFLFSCLVREISPEKMSGKNLQNARE